MIDLNSNEFASTSKVFNDFVVGIIEDVDLTNVTKTFNRETKAPSGYVIEFTKGAPIKHYVNYFNEEADTEGKVAKAVGMSLTHMIHALYGKDYVMPTGQNWIELIDKCMNLVYAKKGSKIRLHTNFGLATNPAQFPKVHRYVPYMELMSVPKAESRLRMNPKFIYERPPQDNTSDDEIANLISASAPPATPNPAMGAGMPQGPTDDLPF